MRKAAGFSSTDDSMGQLGATPNLPGYRNPQHYLEMSRPRRSSLKYVKGFPIVEDLPPSPPAGYGLSSFTAPRPSPDLYDQGSPSPPPLAHYPPSQQQLQQQQAALQRQLQQLQLQQEALRQQEAWQQQQQEQQARARLAAPAAAAAAACVGAGNAGRLSTSRGVLQWNGVKTPGWLLFDRKVLRFHAYSCDRVPYSPVEEVRVRYFDIFYHMEDGSMEMVEPQAENSGLVQGKYLNRHKAKLPNGQPLTHNELRVGQELQLYGRKFMITGCDAATRTFYQELGQPQAPNFSAPEDEYIQKMKAAKAAEEQRRLSRSRPKTAEDNLFDGDLLGPGAVFKFERDTSKQMELDGKILRFFAFWDDTKNTFGQKLPFIIYYYLVNDTVEVSEARLANTGRDPFPLLLKRCQLPKTPNIPPVGGRPMSPNSKKALNIQYYNWRDMRTGNVIYVYGRPLFIYDMDSYTRRWMIEQGVSPAELQPITVDFHMGPKRPPLQIPPDMLRIGAEEDSRRNVISLIPKPPPFDPVHFLENWNKVMRFSARMVPVPGRPLWDPRDADRRFIISYFMLNQTISIFEPRRENSGIPGGKFLERVKVKKEGEDGYITDQDLQIGKVIPIFARYWELLDADHNTCKYMEMHKDKYPHADYDKVMDKVVESLYSRPGAEEELRQALIEEDKSGLGYVTKQQLHAALTRAGVPISLHEATTIVRAVGADLVGIVSEQLLQAIQAHAGYAPSSASASDRDLGDQDLGAAGGGDGVPAGASEGEGGYYGGRGNGSGGFGGGYNRGYNGGYNGAHSGARNGYNGSSGQPSTSNGSAAPSFAPPYTRSESPPAISPPTATMRPQQPQPPQPPQPPLMPGYAPGSIGPLNDPPPPRPSLHNHTHSIHNNHPTSSNPHDPATQLAHARVPPAGGSAQVGGAPYHRPRAWADPSPLSQEPDLGATFRGTLPFSDDAALGSSLASPASGLGSGYGSGYASPPTGAGAGMNGGLGGSGYGGGYNSHSGGYNGGYNGLANGGTRQSIAEPELSLREMAAARNGGGGGGMGMSNGGVGNGGVGMGNGGGGGAMGPSAAPPRPRTAWADEGEQAGFRPSPPASEPPPPQSRPNSSHSFSGPDPRFQRPPGGIGYTPRSKAGPHINPNRSSLDVLSKVPQPKSLWQTSNQAIGGIFNPKSAAQNHRLAASWNRRV